MPGTTPTIITNAGPTTVNWEERPSYQFVQCLFNFINRFPAPPPAEKPSFFKKPKAVEDLLGVDLRQQLKSLHQYTLKLEELMKEEERRRSPTILPKLPSTQAIASNNQNDDDTDPTLLLDTLNKEEEAAGAEYIRSKQTLIDKLDELNKQMTAELQQNTADATAFDAQLSGFQRQALLKQQEIEGATCHGILCFASQQKKEKQAILSEASRVKILKENMQHEAIIAEKKEVYAATSKRLAELSEQHSKKIEQLRARKRTALRKREVRQALEQGYIDDHLTDMNPATLGHQVVCYDLIRQLIENAKLELKQLEEERTEGGFKNDRSAYLSNFIEQGVASQQFLSTISLSFWSSASNDVRFENLIQLSRDEITSLVTHPQQKLPLQAGVRRNLIERAELKVLPGIPHEAMSYLAENEDIEYSDSGDAIVDLTRSLPTDSTAPLIQFHHGTSQMIEAMTKLKFQTLDPLLAKLDPSSQNQINPLYHELQQALEFARNNLTALPSDNSTYRTATYMPSSFTTSNLSRLKSLYAYYYQKLKEEERRHDEKSTQCATLVSSLDAEEKRHDSLRSEILREAIKPFNADIEANESEQIKARASCLGESCFNRELNALKKKHAELTRKKADITQQLVKEGAAIHAKLLQDLKKAREDQQRAIAYSQDYLDAQAQWQKAKRPLAIFQAYLDECGKVMSYALKNKEMFLVIRMFESLTLFKTLLVKLQYHFLSSNNMATAASTIDNIKTVIKQFLDLLHAEFEKLWNFIDNFFAPNSNDKEADGFHRDFKELNPQTQHAIITSGPDPDPALISSFIPFVPGQIMAENKGNINMPTTPVTTTTAVNAPAPALSMQM